MVPTATPVLAYIKVMTASVAAVGVLVWGQPPAVPTRPANPHNPLVRPSAPPAAPLQGVSDDQLVLLMRAREAASERAMDELYTRYSAAVYGLARRMLKDERTAEEVLHDTFWRVWRHADSYEPGRVRFATWILRIAHNLAVSELRRDARRPRPSDSRPDSAEDDDTALLDLPDAAPAVPDQVMRAEQSRALKAGLSSLPAEQRQAVELAYLGGLTHVEIAARQGAPLSTVKTRLALGLRKLATFIRSQRIGVGEEIVGG